MKKARKSERISKTGKPCNRPPLYGSRMTERRYIMLPPELAAVWDDFRTDGIRKLLEDAAKKS